MTAIRHLQSNVGRIFNQRCFYLFLCLVGLIGVAPWVDDSAQGRIVLLVAQATILIAAVAAVGRTTMPFVIALLLGMPALGFQLAGNVWHDDPTTNIERATIFYLAFYVVAVGYLLRFVFSRDAMTDDKLFGAAAGYLMLGIMWTDAYRLAQFHVPGAFAPRADGTPPGFYDLLYMSFGCLTSNGPGDVLPLGSKVRSLVILEQLAGGLFLAILIARLAGIYPLPERPERSSVRP
ncbi:MAG: voltage-gated potassium channel [Burkholderiales bacterium]